MQTQTKFFINEGDKIVEKNIPMEDAVRMYKEDSSNTYPSIFYQLTMRCKSWQIDIGECIGKLYNITSAVDFGCGLGYYLEGFKKSGASRVRGFEMSYDNAKQYMSKDMVDNVSYGNAMESIECGKSDLAMSIEVAEHILPEKSEVLVDNLVNASSKYILFTAAPPGQGGVCHINERERGFWLKLFSDRGFQYSKKDVEAIRAETNKIANNSKYFSLIREQILFFRKDGI